MKAHSAPAIATVLVALMAAGCAEDGTLLSGNLNTSMIDQQAPAQQTAKANPVCLTLASQIEALNKGGVSQKVAKAAAKKYRMKTADLAKANELNKLNAEFQTKCSDYPPPPEPVTASVPKPAKQKVASKKKPPVPAPKPVASAAAVTSSGAVAQPPAQP